MRAMIFAAGLGTRLQPLTANKPKALIEIRGKTLLEITIQKLIQYGYTELVVNVYHFADQVLNYLEKKENFGINIFISNESGLLLDTGGGLLKAAHFLEDSGSFLIHNVDIISEVDLHELEKIHKQSGQRNLATLLVNNRRSDRVFLVNDKNQLRGWKNNRTGETKVPVAGESLHAVSFCGIQMVNAEIFKLITLKGVFSLVDMYLELCRNNEIHCWSNNEAKWMDVGTIENLMEAEKNFF